MDIFVWLDLSIIETYEVQFMLYIYMLFDLALLDKGKLCLVKPILCCLCCYACDLLLKMLVINMPFI